MREATSSGWEAIDAALRPIYGDDEPKHYATVMKWRLGGPDPLDGISAYPRTKPVPHWHIVTYGMSELYEKESADPELSGWGFEFTFRVARDPGADSPPMWALTFLQNLARYVFTSGNVFDVGHHMDLNGPIALAEQDTAIRAIAFARDPELGVVDTANGQVQFLQVVGLTLDEYHAATGWSTAALLDVLARRLPLLTTDTTRSSELADPSIAEAVRAGTERDGSSTDGFFVEVAQWSVDSADDVALRLGAVAAERVGRMLGARLNHGHHLDVSSPKQRITLRPGTRFTTSTDGPHLDLTLPPDLLEEFVAILRPRAGEHRLIGPPGLTVTIVPTQIRDRDGEVVRTIG